MAPSMHADPQLAKRIWEGDAETVEEARLLYALDPEGQLIGWASTLYSFRRYPTCEGELLELLPQLYQHAEMITDTLSGPVINKTVAAPLVAEAETLSSILLWCSTRSLVAGNYPYGVARELVIAALNAWDIKIGDHTPAFLCLTRARLALAPGYFSNDSLEGRSERATGRAYLLIARALAPSVTSANQRARVWRGLAGAYRELKNPLCLWFLLRALCVRGIARDVRRKTLAAILGRA